MDGSDGFQVDPGEVRALAVRWDDEQHDLHGASAQLDRLDLSGFSPRVARMAAGGIAGWAAAIGLQAADCARQAAAMRAATVTLEQADQQVAWGFPCAA